MYLKVKPNFMRLRLHTSLIFILFVLSCTTKEQYRAYQFDNGDDYLVEGMSRVVDQQGRIGYVNARGELVIKPRFTCALPFNAGKAKVTEYGEVKEVPNSKGEYHYCQSDDWYYIDRNGDKVNDIKNME